MDYEIMMNGIVKIGQEAPDFEGISTFGKISLNNYRGRWVVLFSHPGSFTPVKSESWGEYMKTHDIADEKVIEILLILILIDFMQIIFRKDFYLIK